MIVRRAELKDVPRLIELGERFALDSQKAHGLSISCKKIGEFADLSVTSKDCLVLVLEDKEIIGLIVGLLTVPFFSDDIIMQEFVWYVENGGRAGLMLLKGMEKMAKAMGAVKLIVGSKPDYVDMSGIYVKMGYRSLEDQFVKDL